jgi:hypothetical protein
MAFVRARSAGDPAATYRGVTIELDEIDKEIDRTSHGGVVS